MLKIEQYDKMDEYIYSLFNVFKMTHQKSLVKNDQRLKMISLVLYNYIRFKAKENNIDLKNVVETDTINLIPVFEYITFHKIELYDFENINVEEVDVRNNVDLERYILSHVYYITQGN